MRILKASDISFDNSPIHLWYIDLTKIGWTYDQALDVLSPHEERRASAMRHPQYRHNFVFRRALLRYLLASYISSIQPEDIVFCHDAHGKPQISAHIDATLKFNLSHCGNYLAIGVSKGIALGVDIEQVRPETNVLALAKRYFCDSEFHQLLQHSSAEQHEIFFRLWTAKEAYIKATGQGLRAGLNAVELTWDEQLCPSLKAIHGTPNDVRDWGLYHQTAPQNYFVSLVANIDPLPQIHGVIYPQIARMDAD